MDFNLEKPIIAVTGSAGKTMTKTLIASVLREEWIVFESNDYNNTTEKTKEHANRISFIHRAAVLEYGMAYPGVITEHCKIIKPNIGVITNIGFAHIGNFNGNLKELAAAKSELISGLNPSGMLFINADDENSKLLHIDGFTGELITVGINKKADYIAKEVEYSSQGMTFKTILGGQEHSITIPIFGIHNVYNALFAIGVADKLGFSPEEIKMGLVNVKKPEHRLDVKCLRDGIIVIDDTVHAHPTAMKAALDVLAAIGNGQKIAILGSMPELGDRINEYHEEIGAYAASKNIDFLYTYGNISINIGLGAIDAGFPPNKVKHKTPLYRRVLHRELLSLIKPGASILIKGASRLNMFETVNFLCEQYKV